MKLGWVRWLSRGWAHQGPRQFVPFEDEPRPVPDVAGRDLRPAPPPNRANRDLIGYIEEGQHPPLQVPHIDWDTPTGDPMAVARKGFGGGDVGGRGDHYEMMRHTGRPECLIPEHQDALRRLGQALLDREEARKVARHRLDQIAGLERENARLTATVEYYRARLNHPARGMPDAA